MSLNRITPKVIFEKLKLQKDCWETALKKCLFGWEKVVLSLKLGDSSTIYLRNPPQREPTFADVDRSHKLLEATQEPR